MALACRMKADVVIMQVQMPFERAKEALDQMRAVEPTPKVIIVTMFEDPAFIRDLLKLRASGYVLKSGSSQQLVGTVRAAVFAPKEGNVVVGMPREMLEEAEEGSDGVRSARELEILLLAAQGLSNRQIATRIHLAEGTFKRPLHNCRRRLHRAFHHQHCGAQMSFRSEPAALTVIKQPRASKFRASTNRGRIRI